MEEIKARANKVKIETISIENKILFQLKAAFHSKKAEGKVEKASDPSKPLSDRADAAHDAAKAEAKAEKSAAKVTPKPAPRRN